MAHSRTLKRGIVAAALVAAGTFGCRAHAAQSAAPPATIQASWGVSMEEARAVAAEHAVPTTPPKVVVGAIGAAAALAREDAAAALAGLGEGTADPGSAKWVTREATRGRALRLAGKPGEAVPVLEAAVEANTSEKGRLFPADILGHELARARVEWATAGDAPAPDEQLTTAASELGSLLRHKPLRNMAELRVLQARALAAVDGGEGRGPRRAAQKAEKALSRVLRDYPNHPLAGELQLLRAQAVERWGKEREAFDAYRTIWIERAGEPESGEAREAMKRLAGELKGVDADEPSYSENLQRAKHARWLRRTTLSRQLHDEILARPDLAKYQRNETLRERAYTAYRQRDYAQCASDLRTLYEGNASVRSDLVRCLERAHQYDEAMDVYVDMADKRSGGGAAAFLWEAIELGVRGGQYERVRKLLKRYEKSSRGNVVRRTYLKAWIAYRMGEFQDAIEGLEKYERRASGLDRKRARYFRGKIMFLRSEDDALRIAGKELLTRIAEDDPLGYYGLAARQRLLDGGESLPDIELAAVPDEADVPEWGEASELLRELAERHGEASWNSPMR